MKKPPGGVASVLLTDEVNMSDLKRIVKYYKNGWDVTPHIIDSAKWVYIMTNPSMPGMIKIGITKNDVSERCRSLSSFCGVPTPFEIYYASRSACGADVEKRIFQKLDEYRVSPNREFFRCDPEVARTELWMSEIEISGVIHDLDDEVDIFEAAFEKMPHGYFTDTIGGGQGLVYEF